MGRRHSAVRGASLEESHVVGGRPILVRGSTPRGKPNRGKRDGFPPKKLKPAIAVRGHIRQTACTAFCVCRLLQLRTR
jgi:hypothetical protein